MKVDLWLVPAGQAKIAVGRPLDYCDLALSSYNLDMTTQGWIKIDGLIIEAEELPGRDECIKVSLERLSEQERKLREKLNDDLARIEQMRSEMLSLEMAPAPVVTKSQPFEEEDDDLPF